MGNLFSGIVIPKNGDKVAFVTVHGWYISTTDCKNLTQTLDAREGSHFAIEFNGANKISLRVGTTRYLTLRGKEGFEFTEKPEENSYFTPCYQHNKIALMAANEMYLSATNDFKTEQVEIPTEESWFHLYHVGTTLA